MISREGGGQRKHGVYIDDEVALPCAVKNATRTVILAWHPRSGCPPCQFLPFTRATSPKLGCAPRALSQHRAISDRAADDRGRQGGATASSQKRTFGRVPEAVMPARSMRTLIPGRTWSTTGKLPPSRRADHNGLPRTPLCSTTRCHFLGNRSPIRGTMGFGMALEALEDVPNA